MGRNPHHPLLHSTAPFVLTFVDLFHIWIVIYFVPLKAIVVLELTTYSYGHPVSLPSLRRQITPISKNIRAYGPRRPLRRQLQSVKNSLRLHLYRPIHHCLNSQLYTSTWDAGLRSGASGARISPRVHSVCRTPMLLVNWCCSQLHGCLSQSQ